MAQGGGVLSRGSTAVVGNSDGLLEIRSKCLISSMEDGRQTQIH
jgi:hypothetical protein